MFIAIYRREGISMSGAECDSFPFKGRLWFIHPFNWDVCAEMTTLVPAKQINLKILLFGSQPAIIREVRIISMNNQLIS